MGRRRWRRCSYLLIIFFTIRGVVELEVGERWYARRMSMMRGGYDLSFLQPVPFTLRGDRR